MTILETSPPLAAPSDPFGSTFNEKGYTFTAFMPASDAERCEFLLNVAIEGVKRFTVRIPMVYAPRFGVDMGDLAALEAVTDRLIEGLPIAAAFTPEALSVFTNETADFQISLAP